MRFKKRSKVEVWSKEETSCSWLSAEIISGNGHYYSVRYDFTSGVTSEIVERVSRNAIRPCPPLVYIDRWVAGDVVEVFNDACWRTFVISESLHGDFYLVRPLGSLKVLKTHNSNIRVRQLWQDDKWVVVTKDSRKNEDVHWKRLSTLTCYKKSFQAFRADGKRKYPEEEDCLAIRGNICLQESHILSSKALQRAPAHTSSHIDTLNRDVERMRQPKKKARRHGVAQSSLLQKVDAVAYPLGNLGEKCMHASIKNQISEHNDLATRKLLRLVECSSEKSLKQTDVEDDRSSAGSCSAISFRTNEFSSRTCSHQIDTSCSDAESSSGRRDEEEECPIPSKWELAARIHCLELHAYRCTLEAFYASGPLKWEVQALLSDLRVLLNISNDEHLKEDQRVFFASRSKDDVGVTPPGFFNTTTRGNPAGAILPSLLIY